jgi:polysaccharide export outer membrane protein
MKKLLKLSLAIVAIGATVQAQTLAPGTPSQVQLGAPQQTQLPAQAQSSQLQQGGGQLQVQTEIKSSELFESSQGQTESGQLQEGTQELYKEVEKEQPLGYRPAPTASSYIEESFNARLKSLNVKLKQFGYNFFRGFRKLPAAIPVGKDYVVGPGDELLIYVIGAPPIKVPGLLKVPVDREGKIFLPGAGVIYVWGMRLGDVEKVVSRAVGAPVKISVGRLRTFPVYISGEVNRPGAVVVTGVNTLIDALNLAGGVKKTGTLRDIVITRETSKGKREIHVDLYKLLLQGKPVDIKLKDGDVIFVKPIGKVAGISGKVKRPAIYELKGNETVKELIKMAGGLLPSSYKYKALIQRFKDNQYLQLVEGNLEDPNFVNQKVRDGDILMIKEVLSIPKNAILLDGYTPYPGLYEFKPGMMLSELLTPDLFFLDTNMDFALITRQYPPGTPPKYITFAPKDVLNRTYDLELKPADTITFYKIGDVKSVDFNNVKDVVVVEGEIKYPGVYAFRKGLKLSQILTSELVTEDTNLYYGEIERRNPRTLDIVKIIRFTPIKVLKGEEDFKLSKLDTIRFYPKYMYKPILVSGEVKSSYYVPYHPEITLAEALTSANFTANIKDLKVLVFRKENTEQQKSKKEQEEEATSSQEEKEETKASLFLYDVLVKKTKEAQFKLKPGDRLVIVKVKPEEAVEKVQISGYVKHPGVYKIDDNTTLYDILKKSGGFLPNAYPKGIIILRKSVQELQKEKLQKAISLMRQQLEKEEAGIMQSDLTPQELQARQAAYEAKRRLLAEIQKSQVTGRIAGIIVPSDLEKLKNSPYNILLEDGDRIYIPKVPGNVLVFGEVFNPSALVYVKGKTVRDYIDEAGGLTKDADKENIFVIKANGSVISSKTAGMKRFKWDDDTNRIMLSANSIMDYVLEPGDSIIVPTEIHVPTMWRPLIKDVMQIIYQGAVTIYTITKL